MKAGHFRDVHGNEIAATFATEKTRWEDEAEQAAATLVTEKARWEDDAEQAVAAAVKRAQADADDRLATRERQWQGKATRTQEAAVQAARGTAETLAVAALATEKARWEDEAEQAVAAPVKRAQADADERLKEARADGYLQGLRDRLSHSSLPETPRRSGRKPSFFQGR